MRVLKSRWVSVGISLAVIAAAAGITLGVTTLLGVTFQGGGSQPAEGADSAAESAAQRNQLAICIQAVDAGLAADISAQADAKEATAKSRIQAVMPQVATHPYWDLAGRGDSEPVIDTGCPSLPTEPPIPDALYPIEWIEGHIVEARSGYDTFVFILPSEKLEELVRGSSIRTASQETTCTEDLHLCHEVTRAIYLSEKELNDSDLLRRALEDVLALGPRP